MELNAKFIAENFPESPEKIKDISVKEKGIQKIGSLSACTSLRKLDLSNNDLTEGPSIAGLKDAPCLTTLNMSHNKVKSLQGFDLIPQLKVLNLSNNAMTNISTHARLLNNVGALILSHNKLKTVMHLEKMESLNTLVLSNNKIKSLPSFETLKSLLKLSAAHNELTEIPDFSANTALKEVKLNDNKITTIPASLRNCGQLTLVDLGNNQISEWKDIAPLGSLLELHNLNLRGNPIASKEDYREKILALIPSLRILDGTRFDPKFLERKAKHDSNVNILLKRRRKKYSIEARKAQREGADEEKVAALLSKARKRTHDAQQTAEDETTIKNTKKQKTAEGGDRKAKKDDKDTKKATGKASKKKTDKEAPGNKVATKAAAKTDKKSDKADTQVDKKPKKLSKTDDVTKAPDGKKAKKDAATETVKEPKKKEVPSAKSGKKRPAESHEASAKKPKKDITEAKANNKKEKKEAAKPKEAKAKPVQEAKSKEGTKAAEKPSTHKEFFEKVEQSTEQRPAAWDKSTKVSDESRTQTGVVAIQDRKNKVHKVSDDALLAALTKKEEAKSATGLDVASWDD